MLLMAKMAKMAMLPRKTRCLCLAAWGVAVIVSTPYDAERRLDFTAKRNRG
jgi:hypothetical protein